MTRIESQLLPLAPESFRFSPEQILKIVDGLGAVVPPYEDSGLHRQQSVRQWSEDNPISRQMGPATAHNRNAFARQRHMDRLIERERLRDHVQVDAEKIEVGDDFFMDFRKRMFRYTDQRLPIKVLRRNKSKTKEPVPRRNAEHQAFVEQFSGFEFGIRQG